MMLRKKKTAEKINSDVIPGCRRFGRRGSALLIVLGFLSFLMVSAVSFSICMRVERQAAANYKHSSNARHLLNTALVRAMDEIDAELRIQKDSAGYAGLCKFPTNWMGRVLCSAHADGSQNDNNASVLAWDSLAYIPASLVNDVRRFSRPNPDDENEEGPFDDDTAVDSAGREILAYRGAGNYMGAKWRPIRRPVSYLEADNNESLKPTIGRYAYVCVNVSDMPDINKVLASADSKGAVTNNIFIGSLYSGNGDTFDTDNRNKSGHFDTLADFYACMDARNDRVFSNNGTGSPFIDWLTGGPSKGTPDESFGFQNTFSSSARASFFTTDSIVKEEPRDDGGESSSSASLADGDGNLKIWDTTPALKDADYPAANLNNLKISDVFFEALRKSQSQDLSTYNETRMKREFGAMIADYLDDDKYPRSFRAPPMERVPSISRIYLKSPDSWKVKVEGVQTQIGTTDRYKRKWKYTIAYEGNGDAVINVEAIYPFFNESGASASELSMRAAVSIESGLDAAIGAGVNLPPRTIGASFPDANNRKHKYIKGKSTQETVSASKPETIFRPEFNENEFKMEFEIDVDGEFTYDQVWDAPEEVKLRWSLDTFLHEREGYAKQRMDEMLDVAPMFNETVMDWIDLVENDANFPVFEFVPQNDGKITFAGVQPTGTGAGGEPKYELPVVWQHQSFECPDPRYNWRIKNWIGYPSANDRFDRNSLLGVDGRDGDHYQISNDSGSKRFSIGELGFFPRFFAGNSSPGGEVGDTVASSVNDCPNFNDFFRTIRLYDHHNKPADNIYRYFSVRSGANSDEVLSGVRINPLSDQPQVLQMAISHIPSRFSWKAKAEDTPSSWQNVQDEMGYLFCLKGSEVKYNKTLSYEGGNIDSVLGVSKSDFEELVNGWFVGMQAAKRAKLNSSYRVASVVGHSVRENHPGSTMLTSLRSNLYDVYGSKELFKWYTASEGNLNPRKIFDKTMSTDIPECYRKLLFAKSLENFSDRQQLFLIFLIAETQIMTIGETGNAGTKSTAGGKAVALVWRDPYPVGFKKNDGSFTEKPDLYRGSPDGTGVDLSRRVSPWRQYHRKDASDDVASTSASYKSEFAETDAKRRDDVVRSKGFHEMRVLYFRQFTD